MAQAPSDLKKFNVTVRRFDPAKGLASGMDFVLPVDSPDEEHAVSAAMSNAVAFTPKMQDRHRLARRLQLRRRGHPLNASAAPSWRVSNAPIDFWGRGPIRPHTTRRPFPKK